MKREGRGQDPVGGVKEAGQPLCHRDSGAGEEEEEGRSDASLQEAARSSVSLQPLQPIYHCKVAVAAQTTARADDPRRGRANTAAEDRGAQGGIFAIITKQIHAKNSGGNP